MIPRLRAVVFIVEMYAALAVMSLVWAPFALWDRRNAWRAIGAYSRHVRRMAERIVGLRSEIRGPVPAGEVIVACKHQSFFDILLLVSALERPKFIMKDELRYVPFVGWYAKWTSAVPVRRGRGAEAMRKMVADVAAGRAMPGQLVIYPQGTRTAPGDPRPYKVGIHVLYEETGQPCVPAGCNVGVFWPRRGLRRDPGLAVIEFLPPIPPGLAREAFMKRLEEAVETSSDALMAEAGWRAPAAPGPLPGPAEVPE